MDEKVSKEQVLSSIGLLRNYCNQHPTCAGNEEYEPCMFDDASRQCFLYGIFSIDLEAL